MAAIPAGLQSTKRNKPEGIIVIGAHRSGTSMTAGLLRGLGVHMGADCGVLEESAFFRNLNIRLLRSEGASWHHPGPIRAALRDANKREKLAAKLRRGLKEPGRFGLEFPNSKGDRDNGGLHKLWGWKDPRTTLTLPIWRMVFPRARVVHIIRNGVDVARSLIERERKHPKLRFKGLRYLAHRVWPDQWPEFKWRPFRDHQEAFDLWAEYLRFGLEATEHLSPDELFQVRYEDFAADPHSILRGLADFLDISIDRENLERLSSTVDKGRLFAFTADGRLTDFHDRCRDHPMMRRFDYENLPRGL